MSVVAPTLVTVAYLSGSIPFGWIICRLHGIDIRNVGSGNIGATNVSRALGRRWGAVVLLLDALKGYLPVVVARSTLGTVGPGELWLAAAMFAAVLGHVFSIALALRGGKGVATGLGVVLAINPLAAAMGLLAYGLAYGLSRISAVGSLTGATTTLIAMHLLATPPVLRAAVGLIVALIIARHNTNLRQIWTRLRQQRDRHP